MNKPTIILFFFFALLGLDIQASELDFKGHCSAVKTAKYNSRNNSLEVTLKDPIFTLEKKMTSFITIFKQSNKLKAKLAIQSKDALICPEDLSFERAEALKTLAHKALKKNINFSGAMAKEIHIIQI